MINGGRFLETRLLLKKELPLPRIFFFFLVLFLSLLFKVEYKLLSDARSRNFGS